MMPQDHQQQTMMGQLLDSKMETDVNDTPDMNSDLMPAGAKMACCESTDAEPCTDHDAGASRPERASCPPASDRDHPS